MQSAPKLSTVAEHADPPWEYDHRRYLSDAGIEKTASSDESQPDEGDYNEEEIFDEQDEPHIDSESQSFIGISIGAEQTRLASPSTPAAEKAAAIGNDPFARALEQIQQENRTRRANQTDKAERVLGIPNKDHTQERPSSPGRLTSKHHSQSSESALASAWRSVIGNRPRSSSGPSSPSHDRNERKLLPISLPSLPKLSNGHRVSFPTVDSALSWLRSSSIDHAGGQTQSEDRSIKALPVHTATAASEWRPSLADDQRSLRTSGDQIKLSNPPPLLRRSTSDGSLYLARALSRASSLGDDSRWQNVHEQVNSRMKAIKDSLADSNLKMPRFKPAWLDMNFGPKTSEEEAKTSISVNTRDFGHPRNLSAGQINGSRSLQAADSPISPPGGMTKSNAEAHPQFCRALKRLTGDVVILGGYRGSVLRSAEPPNRQLWVPIKVGLGVRKVNLEVGLEPEDEENMEKSIIPSGMLKHIGPVEISRRLFKRLRSSKNARNGTLRVWDYGYDWRLSPHLLSRQLQQFLESLPSNQSNVGSSHKGAIIIAHSLGGLITRHTINSRPDLCSGVLYAGVPQTCVNVLGPLRNGDAVLLSSKVLTAQVNFTIRTSFALLPLDGKCFVDRDTKEEYSVDFFDPKTWDEYCLSPCISRPLPPLSLTPEPQGMVSHIVGSMASVLPSVSFGRGSPSKRSSASGSPVRERGSSVNLVENAREIPRSDPLPGNIHVEPQMDQQTNPQQLGQSDEKAVGTAVTISKEDAVKYLTRTLAEVKSFKQELQHNPDLEEKYPPAAVIYGKSTPTVYGAAVCGREGIKHADAYDNLLFASGDGVVLARAAQIPTGYHVVKGGVVSSDRGHISLLSDLEAVGGCLNAILTDRKRRARHASAAKEACK